MLYPGYLEKRRGLLPRVIVGVVVVLLIAGLGYLVWTKTKKAPSQTNVTTTSNESEKIAPVPKVNANTNADVTDNWWTYTGPDLQFRLRYPRTLTAETTDEGAFFQDATKTNVAAVLYQTRGADEHLTTWHGTEAVGAATLGGVAAKKFAYQQCSRNGSALACTPQTVAIVVERPGNFLAFEFYGDMTLDATEQAMVDSFTFLNTTLID